MPEDGRTSMRDYHLQMQMLDYLHSIYPSVHISLHAGELALGLVPPEGLSLSHSRGCRTWPRRAHWPWRRYPLRGSPHGPPPGDGREASHVEVNLTSNDGILSIKGGDHPLPRTWQYHVPFSLSTDDEGVSRIDLTHEYARAVDTYHFTYPELKNMVRTGLEHAFLPGESLWVSPKSGDSFTQPVAACSGQLGKDEPAGKCADFLRGSEKARQQFELERRFRVFEASF